MYQRIGIELVDEHGEKHAVQWLPQDPPIDEATNTAIVWETALLAAAQKFIGERIERNRYSLLQRLQAEDATEFVCQFGTVTITERGVSYDPNKLDMLKEHLSEEELVKAGAYAAEYAATVQYPRAWNATKLKPFAKRGGEIRNIIEGARSVSAHIAEVKEAKEGN